MNRKRNRKTKRKRARKKEKERKGKKDMGRQRREKRKRKRRKKVRRGSIFLEYNTQAVTCIDMGEGGRMKGRSEESKNQCQYQSFPLSRAWNSQLGALLTVTLAVLRV